MPFLNQQIGQKYFQDNERMWHDKSISGHPMVWQPMTRQKHISKECPQKMHQDDLFIKEIRIYYQLSNEKSSNLNLKPLKYHSSVELIIRGILQVLLYSSNT